MAIKRADRKTISRVGIATLVVGLTLAATGIAGAAPRDEAPNLHQIQICHWDDVNEVFTNPNPAKWQITQPNGHGSHVEDIIPPFAAGEHGGHSWGEYLGLNWTPEAEAFVAAGCVASAGDDGGTDGGDEGTTGGDDAGSDGGDEGTTGGDDAGSDGGDEGTTGGDDAGSDGGDEGTTGGDDAGSDGGDEGTTGGDDGGSDGGDEGTTGGDDAGSDGDTDGEATDDTETLPDVTERTISQPGPLFGPDLQPAAPPTAGPVSPPRAPVEVLGSVTFAPAQSLARTGADSLSVAQLGAILVLVGGLAILASRRLAPLT